MGPTPDQTEALKNHVNALHAMVNDAKAIDWTQIVPLIMQLLQLVINSHVTK